MRRALPWLGPLVVIVILLIRISGPAPRPANAPASEFSAARAYATERQILAGIGPHPIASPANAIVRERILRVLQSLGYETEVERTFACNPHAECGWTQNIIARHPGMASRPAVALMSHYDSVPAGPGASDDGAGVAATLEIARVLQATTFRNPVIFVMTEGEESGLLGAEGYAADVNVPRLAAVVNIDNRGTNGSSLMYETSRNDWSIVRRVLDELPRPATTSLFATIYDLIPHDTDLSVFKRAKKAGINFAAIGNQWAYHTPNDSLENVALSTLQAHGDNALASVRALGTGELQHGIDENGVWFDVLQFFVISWRQSLTIWMALLLLIASIVAAALMIRDEETTLAGVIHGALSLLGVVMTAAIAGYLLAKLGTLRATQTWIAHAGVIVTAMFLAGIAAAIAIPSTLRRFTTDSGMLAGEALVWSALSLALPFVLPGASYIGVVPALVLVVRAYIHTFTGLSHEVGALITSALISIVLLPMAFLIYDGLGNPALPVIAAVVALAFSPVAFAIDEYQPAMIAITGAVVLALLSLVLPGANAARPRRIVIAHISEGSHSRWTANEATPAMRKIATFSRFRWPWAAAYTSWEASAPALQIPQIQLNVVSDTRKEGKRSLVLQLHSNRNASRLAMFFRSEATIDRVSINGVTPPPRPEHFYELVDPGWQRIATHGGNDAVVEILARGSAPISIVATDTTYELPPAGSSLARARDESNAITSHEGDVTQTLVRKTL